MSQSMLLSSMLRMQPELKNPNSRVVAPKSRGRKLLALSLWQTHRSWQSIYYSLELQTGCGGLPQCDVGVTVCGGLPQCDVGVCRACGTGTRVF